MEEKFITFKGSNGTYTVSNFGYMYREEKYITCFRRGRWVYTQIAPKQISGNKLSPKGYKRVNFDGKVHFLHQIIAKFFVPNPLNKKQINHIDGNKLNNRADNLEWVTNQENRDHACKLNLIAHGEKQGGSKLKEQDVIEIRNLLKEKISQKKIAKKYNVSPSCINNIAKNTSWVRLKE